MTFPPHVQRATSLCANMSSTILGAPTEQKGIVQTHPKSMNRCHEHSQFQETQVDAQGVPWSAYHACVQRIHLPSRHRRHSTRSTECHQASPMC